jgi:putative Ca2+/H+ antiporter (TMEM165/GDT1 family)
MSFSHRRDYYAGALMVLVGGGAAYVGSQYQVGSLTHMGPGYFPTALGVILAIIGIIIAGSAAYAPAASPVTAETTSVKPDWRGWLCITGATVLFIALSLYVGLVVATFACVFVAAMGDRENSWKEAALLAAGITVFGVGLFSYILKVQIPLFGSM